MTHLLQFVHDLNPVHRLFLEELYQLGPQKAALPELDSAEVIHVAEARVPPGSVMSSLFVSIVIAHWHITNI
jgi:hypothetical protein